MMDSFLPFWYRLILYTSVIFELRIGSGYIIKCNFSYNSLEKKDLFRVCGILLEFNFMNCWISINFCDQIVFILTNMIYESNTEDVDFL